MTYEDDKFKAAEALGLSLGQLNHFDQTDPFNPENRVEGFISMREDKRYGALYINTVNGTYAPQVIYGTPKILYPFSWSERGERIYHWPATSEVRFYDKLDGSNCVSYYYYDEHDNWFTTYKTRIQPFLKESRYGNWEKLWRRILEKYPEIPSLILPDPTNNESLSLSFEIYGRANKHLIDYDVDLDTALLFGVSRDGNYIVPGDLLDTRGVPTAKLYDKVTNTQDLTDTYNRWRKELEQRNGEQEVFVAEGLVLYLRLLNGGFLPYKCKPEAIEELHWIQGINRHHITMAILKVLEAGIDLTEKSVEDILLQDFTTDSINSDDIKRSIRLQVEEKLRDMEFRRKVIEKYRDIGISVKDDKKNVMREISRYFDRSQMGLVYSVIAGEEGIYG